METPNANDRKQSFRKFIREYTHFASKRLGATTPTRELHVDFKIPYGYECITKLCGQQAENQVGNGQTYRRSRDYVAVTARAKLRHREAMPVL